VFYLFNEIMQKGKAMATKKSKTNDLKQDIVIAALDLAAQRGWAYVSLRDIALACKISMAQLHSMIEDKDDILVLIGRMIDRKVLDNLGEGHGDESVRDRLFDILMDRFEALNDHRDGIVAILEYFKCEPKELIISMPHLCRSMNWMLEAAEVQTSGLKGALRVTGLSLIYIKTLRVWMSDNSPDLTKTMAALDKSLNSAEQVANTLGF